MSSSAPTSTGSSSTSRRRTRWPRATRWRRSGKTLVELFGLARELNIEAEGIEIGPSPTDAALAADLALPIEDLDLTVRSYNCLKREGIHTVGELVSRSEADLLDIRNFGAKSITEVKEKLSGMGLALKDSPPGFDPCAIVDTYGDDYDYDDWRTSASPRVVLTPATSVTTAGPSPRTSGTERLSLGHRPRPDDDYWRQRCLPPPRVPASAAARRTSG